MVNYVLKLKFQEDTRRISLERVPDFPELVQISKQLFGVQEPQFKYEDDEKDLVTIASNSELREAVSVASNSGTILRIFLNEKTAKNAPEPTPAPTPAPISATTSSISNPWVQMLSSMINPQMAQQMAQSWNNPAFVQHMSNMFASIPPTLNNEANQFAQQLASMFQPAPAPTAVPAATAPASPAPATPTTPVADKAKNAPVHENVVCDGCSGPVAGIRYKCTVCHNFDLCEACELKGASVHDPSHPLLKIIVPIASRTWGGRGRTAPYSRWGERRCGRGSGASSHYLPQARFVQDVNMGDRAGSIVYPSAKFTKVWRMRNEGTSAWPENTVLAFVGGDQLGAPEAVIVPAVIPGEEIDISVEMIAPSVPGRYVSYWRLCTPEGSRFGHRVWVDIIVRDQPQLQQPQPASPAPAPVPVPVIPEPEPVPVPMETVKLLRPNINPMDSTAQLELEFEHMSVAPVVPEPQVPAPAFISEPLPPVLDQPLIPAPVAPAPPAISIMPFIPEPIAPAPPVELEMAIPAPAPAPVVAEAPADPQEGAVKILRDMGFEGDLVAVLRRNRWDLMEAVRELLGN